MGGYCCVIGCKNRSNRKSKISNKISFFKFPAEESKKERWISAIGRNFWFPNHNSRVCSEHFPAEFIDRSSKFPRPSWNAVPSLNLGYSSKTINERCTINSQKSKLESEESSTSSPQDSAPAPHHSHHKKEITPSSPSLSNLDTTFMPDHLYFKKQVSLLVSSSIEPPKFLPLSDHLYCKKKVSHTFYSLNKINESQSDHSSDEGMSVEEQELNRISSTVIDDETKNVNGYVDMPYLDQDVTHEFNVIYDGEVMGTSSDEDIPPLQTKSPPPLFYPVRCPHCHCTFTLMVPEKNEEHTTPSHSASSAPVSNSALRIPLVENRDMSSTPLKSKKPAFMADTPKERKLREKLKEKNKKIHSLQMRDNRKVKRIRSLINMLKEVKKSPYIDSSTHK